MKSKLHFSLALGMITLASSQTFAEETHDWINFNTAVAGSAAGGSIAILSSATKTISYRIEGTAYSSKLASSAGIKAELLNPLLAEKAQLAKRLEEVKPIYDKAKADLARQIAASHELLKKGNQVKLTNDGLTPEVSLAFMGTELIEKEYNLLKKQIDFLNKRITAIPMNLESKTYSIYLTTADSERIEKARPIYNSIKLREAEAEKILKRSKTFASIAKIGNSAAIPVAIGTMVATAFVTNNTEKAKAEAANSDRPQAATATASVSAQ